MAEEISPPMCATCKHGLCVQQIMPLDNVNIVGPDHENDIEEWQKGVEESNQESSSIIAIPNVIAYSSVCWWRPDGRVAREPIEMMHVRACSRHELREILKPKGQ